jgi:hypothetical protein
MNERAPWIPKSLVSDEDTYSDRDLVLFSIGLLVGVIIGAVGMLS